VHDNINFLASMATASTPVTPDSTWQQQQQQQTTAGDANMNLQRQMRAMMIQQQQQLNLPQSSTTRNNSFDMQELTQNLNELCYKGFDELNALIQEQRWVNNIILIMKI
jgi:hypothetical protein